MILAEIFGPKSRQEKEKEALTNGKLRGLAENLGEFMQNGIAKSTRKSYDAAIKRYKSWCKEHEVEFGIPLSHLNVSLYIQDITKNNRVGYGSISLVICALSWLNELSGYKPLNENSLVKNSA